MLGGMGFEGFLAIHYLRAGAFSPHKWAGFVGLGLFLLGLMFLMMGIIGDMLNRHRIYLEEVLYYTRWQNWQRHRRDRLAQTAAQSDDL
jgi:hypothetical protein